MNFKISFTDVDNLEFLVLNPCDKLSDTEYDKLKPYLEGMGGHWREKVGGFVFSLESISRDMYLQWQEDNQFFPTPKAVAKRLIELSGIKEYSYNNKPFILEPSAGQGSLLDELQIGIDLNYSEYVVEPNECNAEVLNNKGHVVQLMTFEEFYAKHKNDEKHITHIIMNPPFSKGRDIKHTMMAYDLLIPGGTLVAVVSENSLYYKNENTDKFNDWLKKHNAYIESVPYGSFKDSGTTVDTVIIKIVKEA